jgi:perosamine synthetase
MIRLIKPYIKYSDVEADFKKVFETGMFTRGEYVPQLIDALKKQTKSKYVYLASSATTALWACLKAFDVKAGDEVLVSDFSFPASANVIEDLGATPVFVDVDLETYNSTAEAFESKISSKTKGILFVDALGNPAFLHDVKELCKKKNLFFLEDAACAIGSKTKSQPVGSIADATCFSFHPRKLLTSGEGGFISTNDDNLAKFFDVKLMHGGVFSSDREGLDFIDYGYNFRLPDLQAIMILKQLPKLDALVLKRNEFKKNLSKLMNSIGFKEQKVNLEDLHNVQSLVYTVPEKMNRNQLIRRLREIGLESTLGTYSLSAGTYFKEKYGVLNKNSLFLQDNTITLPCHDETSPEEVFQYIKKATEV